jgi:hypothetical protein
VAWDAGPETIVKQLELLPWQSTQRHPIPRPAFRGVPSLADTAVGNARPA